MKLLRNLLIILLCFAMTFSVISCDEENPTPDTGDNGTQPPETPDDNGDSGKPSTPGTVDPTINLGEMYTDALFNELEKVKSITMMLTLKSESYTGAYTDGLGNTDGSTASTEVDEENFQIIVSLTDSGANVCIMPIDYETEEVNKAIYVIDGTVYEYDGITDTYTEIVDGVDSAAAMIGAAIAGGIKVEAGSIVIDEELMTSISDAIADGYRVDLPTSSLIFEKSFADKPTELIEYFANVDISKTSTAEIIDHLVAFFGGEFSTLDAISALKGNGEITVGEIAIAVEGLTKQTLGMTLQDVWDTLIGNPEFTDALIESGLATEEKISSLATLNANEYISQYAEMTLDDIAAMLVASEEGEPSITLDGIIDTAIGVLSMPIENLGIITREMQYRLKNTVIEKAVVGMSFSLNASNGYLPSFYANFKLSSIDIHEDGAQYVAKIEYGASATLTVISFSDTEIKMGLPKA